ncbi:hypothetical protein EST38_g12286 [Candolleomyces aberdarensis]|uniref:Protein arginine methyltransferase NDUFAF7 n=1 Tax=Candolleomyces aberdarensis TaxID=2316362 RepID=A0A4Q2D5W5_9AGAR|nr:hypothetical protein EST38_g12286 [Candolleomyces aberdarensis]
MLVSRLAASRCRSIAFRSFSQASQYSTAPPKTPKYRKDQGKEEPSDRWNYNKSALVPTAVEDLASLPTVTANELESAKTPPVGVKMLVRDFIEDSLYNHNYGYFPKQATIFNTDAMPLEFSKLRNSVEFQEVVAQKYADYGSDSYEGPGRQLWHTPTELFKPYYAQAIAQCLVSEYLLKYFPYEDFIIYEIGAGNGTLAMDILNYLQEYYPMVYERTRYNIIEISSSLVRQQKKRLSSAHPCAKVYHRSIFHWKTREPAPCYFVAMEVIDNFAHDIVRYDLRTMQPYQGVVTISQDGDFDIVYTPVSDPLISSLLGIRSSLRHEPPISRPLRSSSFLRQAYANLPFAPNLSREEYVPTRLLSLLRTLRTNFPRHRLLLSDFSSLPETIPGHNAPVVQTRFRNTTIPCSTLLVKQGYFDIFFPTDFERLRDMYEYLLSQPHSVKNSSDRAIPSRSTPLMSSTSSLSLGSDFFSSTYPADRRTPLDGVASSSGLPVGERKSNVFTHAEFLETYADLGKTTLRNGENPMLDFYKNVKFLF